MNTASKNVADFAELIRENDRHIMEAFAAGAKAVRDREADWARIYFDALRGYYSDRDLMVRSLRMRGGDVDMDVYGRRGLPEYEKRRRGEA